MLEVCVEDLGGVEEALAGGAHRIELCSALAVGGLTPPVALIRTAVHARIPVHALIRPRAGDFLYDAAEAELMATDLRAAVAAGAAGVVIGATQAEARLDVALLERLVGVAHEAGERHGRFVAVTLHRAFDACTDQSGALEAAITLGFDRVLTSGGAESAIKGLQTLAALVRQARGRVRILAAGGIDPGNVGAILAVGVDEIHASCRRPQGRTTAASVKALVAAMEDWNSTRSPSA